VTIAGGNLTGLDFGAFLAETLFTTQIPAIIFDAARS
jgi:hypothetical protein